MNLRNLSAGNLWPGALLGSLVVLIWWVNRSDVIQFDPTLGMGLIGTWRSRSIAGGIWVGFVAGLVSSVTVLGDHWFYGIFPFYDPMSFVSTMAISAAVVLSLVTIGAALADFLGTAWRWSQRRRIRRRIAPDPDLTT